MRISQERYSRDVRRFNLALRMLGHEARTHTICAWTALKPERVRNLMKSYAPVRSGRPVERHRGPSPSKLRALLCTASLRSEVAAMAGLCRQLEVIPAEPCPNAFTTLPSVSRGERLCYAYELFGEIVPNARLSLDQVVLLVLTLADGHGWVIEHCVRCPAIILVDRMSLTPVTLCVHCQQEERLAPEARLPVLGPTETPPDTSEAAEPLPGQQSLF